MKILHIVEDFSLESGGLRTVIKDLNYYLNKAGFSSYILSSREENGDNIFTVETTKPWLYSKEWKAKIKSLQEKYEFDVFHIHGVWMYPQYISTKFCVRNKLPFIVSAHGMYEPWLWKNGTLKKNIYFNLLAKTTFKKANFLHAITPQEKGNLSKLFNKKEIVEIPNLIQKREHSDVYNNKEKYILYLGRLDEKKGIDILLKAFAELETFNFTIKIAGQINNYKIELDGLVEKLQLKAKVSFLGMVSGEKKEELIKNAFVLVAPSYSEVIGMVNLEAAILKTPVITTHQTGLNPLWNENGGKLINPNITELKNTLNEVLNWSEKERNENGNKLYNFACENYSWTKKLQCWIDLYTSCKKDKHE